MAHKAPAFVATTTSTSGTGTYTLDDPASPGAGLRTLVDAVNAGAVANGDTVGYSVEDDTKQGAALEFERGIGTVGGGGTTLARTTIRENHLGTTAAVNWPGGGSRTVRISLSPDDVGRLAAAQTWTGANTFSARTTHTPNDVAIKVDRSGGSGVVDIGGSLSASVVGLLRFFGHDSGGVDQVYASLRGVIADATAGSEDGVLDVLLPVAGTDTLTHRFGNDGGLTNQVTAQAFAYQGVLDAPAPTRLLLGNNVVPAGWSIVASLADKTILTTSTVSEIDDVGGSWTISGLDVTGSTDGHALTIAQMPAHTHPPASGNFFQISATPGTFDSTAGGGTDAQDEGATGSTGGGGTHSHGLTGAGVSSDGAWRPSYYKAGWVVKS